MIGILGGMGTQAGLDFCNKLAILNRGKIDQEYPLFLLYNKSNIPGRPESIGIQTKSLSNKSTNKVSKIKYNKVLKSLLESPATRFGVPDMHFHTWFLGMRRAMEMMMTGDSISGVEAVAEGWANRAFPADSLEDEVLKIAERITKTPSDLTQLNKRVVHRQMEIMGLRTGIRAGTELCSLGIHTDSMQQFIGKIQDKGLTEALSERDGEYGDYRTTEE